MVAVAGWRCRAGRGREVACMPDLGARSQVWTLTNPKPPKPKSSGPGARKPSKVPTHYAAECAYPSRTEAEHALRCAEPKYDLNAAAELLRMVKYMLELPEKAELFPNTTRADLLWALEPARLARYSATFAPGTEHSAPVEQLLAAVISDLNGRAMAECKKAGTDEVKYALDRFEFDVPKCEAWLLAIGELRSREVRRDARRDTCRDIRRAARRDVRT